jgi:hypothetical protein
MKKHFECKKKKKKKKKKNKNFLFIYYQFLFKKKKKKKKKNLLKASLVWKVGNDNSIKIWGDKWL